MSDDSDGGFDFGTATAEESADPSTDEPFEQQPVGSGAEPTDRDDESIVPKRSFCERCEWFSEPPEVACTHEGTRILELVDRTHFRVVNCPVVAERDELADSARVGAMPEQDGPTDAE